jgi:tetratricopeptide (TPR) repeat protein
MLNFEAHSDLPVEERQHLLDDAIREEPSNPQPRFVLGTLLHQQLDHEGALGWFEEAFKVGPSFELCCQTADFYLKASDAGQAVRWYVRAADMEKANPELYLKIANLYEVQLKQPLEAVAWQQKVFTVRPNPETLDKIARLYISMKMYDAAIHHLVFAVRLDPTHFWSCDRLAEIFRDEYDDPRGAIEWFKISMTRHPIAWTCDRIAEIYLKLDDVEQAQVWFEKAIDVDTKNFWSCDRLAEICRDRLKDYQQAIFWFTESYMRHPIPWVCDRMAEIYRDFVGNYNNATGWFERAAQLDENNYWSCDRLGDLYHYQLDELEQAIAWYKESFRRHPIPWPCDAIASIYRDHQGDIPQAIYWLEQSVACDPTSTWVCDRLAELYFYHLNDVEKAREWNQKSLSRRRTEPSLRRMATVYREGLADQATANAMQDEAIRCSFPWALPPRDGSSPFSADSAVAAATGSGRAPPGLVLSLDAQQRPCFNPVSHADRPRVFAITIPKSGTYLLAALLDELGLVGCDVHLATDTFDDQRGVPFYMSRTYPELLTHRMPLSFTANLILEGQYGYGHIECTAANQATLAGFRKIFIYRNLRDGLISLLRHHMKIKEGSPLRTLIKRGRSDAEMLHRLLDAVGFIEAQTYRRIAGWKQRDDIAKFSYETLVGDLGPEAQLAAVSEIAAIAGASLTPDVLMATLRKSLGKETQTSSGKRSHWQAYWNDTIETLFHHCGFHELNQMFGYEK